MRLFTVQPLFKVIGSIRGIEQIRVEVEGGYIDCHHRLDRILNIDACFFLFNTQNIVCADHIEFT